MTPKAPSSKAKADETPVGAVSEQLRQFVAQIPKVELHAHLNGCIRESTLFELAAERNVKLSSHHFNLEDSSPSTNNGGYMYNLKPRSLLDCFDMFAEIPSCVNDLQALARISREALDDFSHHHVAYMELRSTPKCLLRKHGDNTVRATKRDYVEAVLSVMEAFEQKESERYSREIEAQPRCRLPLVPRFIVSIDRSGTVQDAMENAQLAIDLYRSGNPYVVGVDLGGNPTKNDFSDFVPALQMARDTGLKVTVHCGEVPCGDGSEEDNASLSKAYKEMEAVLRFVPDRLGHALLLPKSLRPALDRALIPVECCPTSNVMTLELATHMDGNLAEGLKRHPQLGHWLNTNYPLSVSTDDSGVFNTDATQELLLLAMAWGVDEEGLQQIVMQSLDHAFCSTDVKLRLKERFLDQVEQLEKGSR